MLPGAKGYSSSFAAMAEEEELPRLGGILGPFSPAAEGVWVVPRDLEREGDGRHTPTSGGCFFYLPGPRQAARWVEEGGEKSGRVGGWAKQPLSPTRTGGHPLSRGLAATGGSEQDDTVELH